MDTILLVSTGSTFYTPLDLYDDVSIQVDIMEGDLSGFERRSNYSKSFRIPATDRNSKIFKNFYEVNGTDYNPYAALPCSVQINGDDVFRGTLRLNAVYRNKLYDEYEVFILQELVDFSTTLGDIKLQDLDWTEYNHEVNYDNITTSWSATTGDTQGLFGGDVIYPMINYGLEYNGTTPDFDYCIGSSPCFNNSDSSLPESIWRPSMRIKTIMDKIFDYVGYAYSSSFIESPFFKLLYMDLGYDNQLGVSSPTETENLNFFKVYTPESEYISYTLTGSEDGAPVAFRTLDPDGYDNLSNYTLAEGQTPESERLNYFAVPKDGTYGFEFRTSYTKIGSFNEDLRIQVRAVKASTPEGLATGTTINSQVIDCDDTEQQLLFLFSDTLSAGEYVGIYVERIDMGSGYNNFQTLIFTPYDSNYPAPMFRLYSSPTLGIEDFEGNKNMPDIKAIDFLRSIIRMFNLVFLVNNTKTITIEPFDYYFQNDFRTIKDWSDKLDVSTSYTIKPFDFELPKTQTFTYKSGGNEVNSKYYEFQFNEIFGERILIKESNILKGEDTLQPIFRPTPTTAISGSDWMIIPEYYERNDEGLKVPTTTEPHIFFWLGNRYTYTTYSASTSSSWYLTSGNTQVQWSTYPCVSHLSQLNSGQTESQFSDLNFKPHYDFFANSNQYIEQFTSNNIYKNFHEQLYQEKYSNDSRKLVGRFFLTPNDIGQLNLTDKIFVKDSMYRIEKITGASLTENKLTEVSLIKELNGGFYWKESPVNNPSIPPNDPIP